MKKKFIIWSIYELIKTQHNRTILAGGYRDAYKDGDNQFFAYQSAYLNQLKTFFKSLIFDNPIYKFSGIGTSNLSSEKIPYKDVGFCLICPYDLKEYYVDSNLDFCCDVESSTGKKLHYVYRELKDGLSDTEIRHFEEKLSNSTLTTKDIFRYTQKIGDRVKDYYEKKGLIW